ncbi:MAG: pantoate--beta-alanine ligase [Gemmatimonadales bacterium]
MLQCASPAELRDWVRSVRARGLRVGFVPTMGALHEGHLRLVDAAREKTDVVVMSIFVNPLQFGPAEDLARYPRDLERDAGLAAERGVDLLFVPEETTMYPPGSETRVTAGAAGELWEGAARPGHFTGVLTVVAKLFHLVTPDVACFGQKDIQQVAVVKRMVRDLDWELEIVVVPTVREADGLALSSRNAYLSPEDRRAALALSQALGAAHVAWEGGARQAGQLRTRMEEVFRVLPHVAVEYIAMVEAETMRPVEAVDACTVVAVAARVGQTRLIDNVILGQGVR